MAQRSDKQPAASKEPKPSEKKKHREELLDEALDETFPASDPVAMIEPGPDGPENDENGQ